MGGLADVLQIDLLTAERRAAETHAKRLTDTDGAMVLHECFVAPDEASAVFDTLRHEVAWQTEEITFFGKTVRAPRRVCWYGDPDTVYTYSGVRHDPRPWTPTLAALRARIEAATGATFNSVLANLYRDGNDSMGWHADKEKELGDAPVIASLSFGAARLFRARHRRSKQTLDVVLRAGDLLVMSGAFQKNWRHGVPKQRGVGTPRINLTFRRIFAQ